MRASIPSRMTIVVRGNDATLEQVSKLLAKLIDVIEVQDFRDGEYVDRELVLMRVNAEPPTRPEIMQMCEIFRAKVVDMQTNSLVIELTGHEAKINKFLKMMGPFGITALARTGKVAMTRSE